MVQNGSVEQKPQCLMILGFILHAYLCMSSPQSARFIAKSCLVVQELIEVGQVQVVGIHSTNRTEDRREGLLTFLASNYHPN